MGGELALGARRNVDRDVERAVVLHDALDVLGRGRVQIDRRARGDRIGGRVEVVVVEDQLLAALDLATDPLGIVPVHVRQLASDQRGHVLAVNRGLETGHAITDLRVVVGLAADLDRIDDQVMALCGHRDFEAADEERLRWIAGDLHDLAVFDVFARLDLITLAADLNAARGLGQAQTDVVAVLRRGVRGGLLGVIRR